MLVFVFDAFGAHLCTALSLDGHVIQYLTILALQLAAERSRRSTREKGGA